MGISKAEFLEEEAQRLEDWLTQGNHSTMSYMADHFDKRLDPSKLVPGARSVISLVFNYYTEDKQLDKDAPKVAMYAYGKDYHKIIKKRLKQLLIELREQFGDIDGRCFVDSAPVMERQWAARSGLGWQGKNTLLINTKKGSYFFLAEIISDLKLEYDHPIKDHCGTCSKCIDACPTEAISADGYLLDSNKCISYLTIERKEDLPEELRDKMSNWMFGCDICQEVCPWNRFSTPHQEPKLVAKEELLKKSKKEWQEITEEVFDKLFEGSAVKRTKFKGLKRNIDFLN